MNESSLEMKGALEFVLSAVAVSPNPRASAKLLKTNERL
jgi:hypothetical protein